jgi:hypothetical protein
MNFSLKCVDSLVMMHLLITVHYHTIEKSIPAFFI